MDLDNDLGGGAVVIAERRPVDLGDRGCCEGNRIERCEDVVEGSAELALDEDLDCFVGFGGHPVPAQLELLDQLAREQALAGGDDLAEFDVGRPELGHRLAEAA